MPTLHWIGKDKVINHHLKVPYHILKKQYAFGNVEKSENKIIHGDNLDALKSLPPEYEGKVKCIYNNGKNTVTRAQFLLVIAEDFGETSSYAYQYTQTLSFSK